MGEATCAAGYTYYQHQDDDCKGLGNPPNVIARTATCCVREGAAVPSGASLPTTTAATTTANAATTVANAATTFALGSGPCMCLSTTLLLLVATVLSLV